MGRITTKLEPVSEESELMNVIDISCSEGTTVIDSYIPPFGCPSNCLFSTVVPQKDVMVIEDIYNY